MVGRAEQGEIINLVGKHFTVLDNVLDVVDRAAAHDAPEPAALAHLALHGCLDLRALVQSLLLTAVEQYSLPTSV
jgi:hypothetical protein